MTAKSDIASLRKRRAIVKAACTRIDSYINSIPSITVSVTSQIEERKIRLDQYWGEYNQLQSQLELLDDSEAQDRIAFEEAFYNLSSKIRDMLRPPSTSRHTAAASPTSSSPLDHPLPSFNVRLPKLDLPKFSGKYDEWFPFHDAFHSVIHSNSSLSNIHKMQYLRAATTENAHEVINLLEISETNYEVAWNLLRERYDHKRVIVQNYVIVSE